MTVADPMQALVLVANEPAWLVGGAVRDRALGRPTDDYDVALEGDARSLARALARRADAHAFALSEAFGVWRVVDRARRWQVDVLPLAGHSIEADLAGRDFTVNAMAEPLGGGPHVDPFGGLSDLRERRLRMVSPRAFAEDPLRTLRLARLAGELGFAADPHTVLAAAARAPALAQVAPERIFGELKRILVSDRALQGLSLMDEVRATEVVLPELTAMRGVERSAEQADTAVSPTPSAATAHMRRASFRPCSPVQALALPEQMTMPRMSSRGSRSRPAAVRATGAMAGCTRSGPDGGTPAPLSALRASAHEPRRAALRERPVPPRCR